MKYPTIGDKVRATDVPKENLVYLTDGGVYDVIWADGLGFGFKVMGNRGIELFCLYPQCAHATWEIAE